MTATTFRRLTRLAAVLALVPPLHGAPAAAQGFAMSRASAQQIEVFADSGIEWLSEDKRVIARGNAKAVRGTMTVDADSLTAYYRDGAAGDEIWRLDADGSVVIRSPTDTATGTKAIYDLDKALFVLKGSPARLVTPTDHFQASDSLEYWEIEKMAVLRGDAVAIRDTRTIRADVLTAHFRDKAQPAAGTGPAGAGKPAPAARSGGGVAAAADGEDSSLELQHADAYGHVRITTETETVTGDRGDYDADTGIATVSGAVKLTREGGNQLEGGWAYVNLNTGISKLFPAPPGTGGEPGKRVQGLFIPQKRDATAGRDGPAGAGGRPAGLPSTEEMGRQQ